MAKLCLTALLLVAATTIHAAQGSKVEERIKQFLTNPTSLLQTHAREPAIQAACNENLPCVDGSQQICNMGRCQCPNPSESTLWSSSTSCQIDIGRPCEQSPGAIPCYDTTECVLDSDSRTGYSCKCRDGLETTGIFCTNGYMRHCTTWWPGKNGCNVGAGLSCIQEKCQCEFEGDMTYDPIKKRCVSLPGFTCLVLEANYFDCVTGYKCVRNEGSTEWPSLGYCRPE